MKAKAASINQRNGENNGGAPGSASSAKMAAMKSIINGEIMASSAKMAGNEISKKSICRKQ
jgi:hypothetical protein